MATEIERKFLVKDSFDPSKADQSYHIKQGYISTDPNRTVRVRIRNNEAFLTIKGKSNESGTSRYEWEKAIDKNEAEELMLLSLPGVIEKTRHILSQGLHIFEVDVFYGENEGLILAEVELKDENESFDRPEWLGTEVTGDRRYYNSKLMETPYGKWK